MSRVCTPGSPARRWASFVAIAAAAFVGPRPAAWALCADGTTFPAGGFVVGQPPVPSIANWSPTVFTAPVGSYFVPDASVFEHNDPAQPLTGGGHDWVFDQGSTLCKVGDLGPAGGTTTSWSQPAAGSADCVLLPVVVGGAIVQSAGVDVPGAGDVITPTCDPAKLSAPGAPNPANTYLNQLGCSISRGAATTPQTATSFIFTTGIHSGLFVVPLLNVASPVVGGTAGKVPAGPVGLQNYYSAIPSGQKLTSAAVSKDGQLVIASSSRTSQSVFACLNPLGDPGDPSLPLNPSFTIPPAGSVPCMQVANNALAVDRMDAFGADGQPYLAGQPGVNTIGATPGGGANAAWPQCIWKNNGSLSLADAFAHKRQNGCGNAQPDAAFSAAGVAQPTAVYSHGQYLYAALSGTVVQLKVTKDPASGLSQYAFRTYVTGTASPSGLGVADDLRSVLVYDNPACITECWSTTKLPLCEDM